MTRVVRTRKLIPRSKAKASIITLNADFCADVKLPLAWYIFAVTTCKAVKEVVVSHRSSRRRYSISRIFVALKSRKRSSVKWRLDEQFGGLRFTSVHVGREAEVWAYMYGCYIIAWILLLFIRQKSLIGYQQIESASRGERLDSGDLHPHRIYPIIILIPTHSYHYWATIMLYLVQG